MIKYINVTFLSRLILLSSLVIPCRTMPTNLTDAGRLPFFELKPQESIKKVVSPMTISTTTRIFKMIYNESIHTNESTEFEESEESEESDESSNTAELGNSTFAVVTVTSTTISIIKEAAREGSSRIGDIPQAPPGEHINDPPQLEAIEVLSKKGLTKARVTRPKQTKGVQIIKKRSTKVGVTSLKQTNGVHMDQNEIIEVDIIEQCLKELGISTQIANLNADQWRLVKGKLKDKYVLNDWKCNSMKEKCNFMKEKCDFLKEKCDFLKEKIEIVSNDAAFSEFLINTRTKSVIFEEETIKLLGFEKVDNNRYETMIWTKLENKKNIPPNKEKLALAQLPRELIPTDKHYRHWILILHFADDRSSPQLARLRKSLRYDRNEYHMFAQSMQVLNRIFSTSLHGKLMNLTYMKLEHIDIYMKFLSKELKSAIKHFLGSEN